MINTPIYRAKQLNGDKYIEGWLVGMFIFTKLSVPDETTQICNQGEEVHLCESVMHRIDVNTLAIHFENMVDKNNVPIFASLNEDGVGGDEMAYLFNNGNIDDEYSSTGVFRFYNNGFYFCTNKVRDIQEPMSDLDLSDEWVVIGIYKETK